MSGHVAVFVDGENISAGQATAIRKIASGHGTVDVARVYGNAAAQPKWDGQPGFRFIHSGTGKNATDILLTVQAMEAALSGSFAVVVIASSDRDFTHLATRIRELGITVVGIGETKAAEQFRAACTCFVVVASAVAKPVVNVVPAPPKPDTRAPKAGPLDLKLRDFIKANSTNGQGVAIQIVGPQMHRQHGVQISSHPEKTWRSYFTQRPDLFDLDPKGPDAKVRFRPSGFSANN